jgi:hypothetical protein
MVAHGITQNFFFDTSLFAVALGTLNLLSQVVEAWRNRRTSLPPANRATLRQAQGKRHGRKRLTVPGEKGSEETLAERYPELTDSSVPDFVLAEAKYVAETLGSDLQAVGTRAASLVGFAGTVAAIVSGLHAMFPPWAQILGILLLLASVGFGIATMFVRSIAYPTLDEYLAYEDVVDPTNKARMALELAGSYLEFNRDLSTMLGKKALFLKWSFICFVAGVAIFMVSIITQALCHTNP